MDIEKAPATGTERREPELAIADSWQRYLDPDLFSAEGRKSGLLLPQVAGSGQVSAERNRVAEWARSAGLMMVLDKYRISEKQVDAQAEKVNDLRESMDNKEQRVLDKRKLLNDIRSEGIQDAPKRPSIWLFLAVGAALGLVFGLIGATTIASILQSIWQADVADPQTFYMKWAAALGVFVGLVVGTVTILTREHAAGASKFVRWGPFLMGLCFTLGLSGYRFLQPGETGGMEIHVSGIAIVLMFMEMGVLLAIEVNNLVALSAWEKFHAVNHDFQQWAGREKAAQLAMESESKVFEEAKLRLSREYAALEAMQDQDRFYKHATANIEPFKEYAAQAAVRGFDLGWGREALVVRVGLSHGLVPMLVAGLVVVSISCGSSSETTRRRPLSHIAYVMDRSDGLEKGDGAGCSSVRSLVVAALAEEDPFRKGQALEAVGEDVYQHDPVVVRLWGTADVTERGTPLLLGEGTFKPHSDSMEDFARTLKMRELRAQTLGAKLEQQCRDAAQPQHTSPIYSVIAAVVGELRNDCPSDKECLLVIHSDLGETEEPGLKRAVTAIAKGNSINDHAAGLPPPIDLGGSLTVLVCGYGTSTDVIREPARLEIVRLWKEKILVNPRRWAQQPQCPVAKLPPGSGG